MHREARYWDAVAEEWERKRPDLLWRQHCDAVNLRLLTRWLPRSAVPRLLKTDLFDEAVSSGLQPLLKGRARLVVATDLSYRTAQVASAHCPDIEAVCADARRLPFADGAFDVIVSLSTLDHFHSQAEIIDSLRDLHRVLRPGGLLVLTMDNLANPLIALRNVLPFRLLKRLGIVPYYVGASAGPCGVRKLLERTGWDIRESGAIMHCPRAAMVLLSRVIERLARGETQKWFLRLLMRFESWERGPARYLTGNFVAVLAVRPHTPAT